MASAKAIDAAAAAWFAKRDAGEWQDQDKAEFDAWLAGDVRHRIAFFRVESAWKQAERLKALGAGIESGTVPDIGEWRFSPMYDQQDATTKASRLRQDRALMRRVLAAAACLAFVVVGVSVWYAKFGAFTEYRTPVGGLELVPLTDGSTVTLNTNSEIRVSLTDSARTVKLPRGEAFFEVAKDSRRPFVVDAGRKRVIAVGTKFSVWNDGDMIRVAVAEGHVRVEENDGGATPPVQLKPGDIARVERDNVLVHHKPLEMLEAEELSWRDGYIVFHDKPLGEALSEFNRYSTQKAVVHDPELAAIKIGGSFRVTNVTAFLRLLEQGFPVRAVKQGDEIVLEHD
jgi:transmembrane sensor